MAIHIDGSGNVQKNTFIPRQENVQNEQKVYSIFDENQDGEISTSEQMSQVDNKASTFGNYVGVWYSHIARFFQNSVSYVTNSTAANKATQVVQQCIANAMKYLQHSVDKGDDSAFLTESTEVITNSDGHITKKPYSYISTRNENGELVQDGNDGARRTFSSENDFLTNKWEKDGVTIIRNYNEDGSYTQTENDGTVLKFNANDEQISRINPDGSAYNYKNNKDGSYSVYNANDTTWTDSYREDDSLMAERTQRGNYKFYPIKNISISEVANMLGVSESELCKANPRAAIDGEFVPPNDIYVPKSILPEDFDPSKVIV